MQSQRGSTSLYLHLYLHLHLPSPLGPALCSIPIYLLAELFLILFPFLLVLPVDVDMTWGGGRRGDADREGQSSMRRMGVDTYDRVAWPIDDAKIEHAVGRDEREITSPPLWGSVMHWYTTQKRGTFLLFLQGARCMSLLAGGIPEHPSFGCVHQCVAAIGDCFLSSTLLKLFTPPHEFLR